MLDVLKEIKDVYSCSEKEGLLLYKLANECTGKGVIVEIGSWKGYSTIWIANGSKAGNNVPVKAIDTFKGDVLNYGNGEIDTLKEFCSNIKKARVDDIVESYVGTSEQVEKNFILNVEFIFIDGDHEDAFNDFIRWYPHVVEGGVIALHDTVAWPSMNPFEAVEEWMYKGSNFKNIKHVGSITYATKCEHLTEQDIKNNRHALYRRYVYQFFIPHINRAKNIASEIIDECCWR